MALIYLLIAGFLWIGFTMNEPTPNKIYYPVNNIYFEGRSMYGLTNAETANYFYQPRDIFCIQGKSPSHEPICEKNNGDIFYLLLIYTYMVIAPLEKLFIHVFATPTNFVDDDEEIELKNEGIKIATMIANYNCGSKIILENIVKYCSPENGMVRLEGQRDTKNGIEIITDNVKFKVFKNGGCHIFGCKTKKELVASVNKLFELLYKGRIEKINGIDTEIRFVVNPESLCVSNLNISIISSFELGYRVCHKKFAHLIRGNYNNNISLHILNLIIVDDNGKIKIRLYQSGRVITITKIRLDDSLGDDQYDTSKIIDFEEFINRSPLFKKIIESKRNFVDLTNKYIKQIRVKNFNKK